MAHIRWSTNLPNKRISTIYSWSDVGGGVYICSNEKAEKRVENRTGTCAGGSQVHLTHAEMKWICESYLRSILPEDERDHLSHVLEHTL